MTRRKLFSLLLPLGSALWLSGCFSAPRRLRYRFTLEVATPDGLRAGSSVLETVESYNDGPLGVMSNSAVNFGTRGEATAVDLGARGVLFVLLTRDPVRKGSTSVFGAFSERHRDLWDPTGIGPGAMDRMAKVSGETPISAQMLPILVRFRDVDDPLTVERVDPIDLAASFGPGVQFERAYVEITNEHVSTGIEKRLRWLAALKGDYLGGGRTSRNAPLGLFGGNFKFGD